jgi:hypothetical protein
MAPAVSYVLLYIQVTPKTRNYFQYSVGLCDIFPNGVAKKKNKKKNCHNRAPASGEYTITLEDGRVRPKHVYD